MNTLQKFGFHGEMATLNRSLFAYNKPLKVLHNKEWEYPGQKGGKTMSFNFNINGSVLTPKGEQYPAANYGAGMRVSTSFNGTWDGYVYRYCFIVSGDKTYLFKMTKGDNDTWTTDLSGRGVSGTVINISFYGTKNEYPKNNDTANPRMTTNSLMIHLDDSLAGHITPSTNIDKSLASDILNAINTAESNSSSAGAAAHNAEEFAKQAQSSAQSAKDQADASARSAKASSDSATASGNSASYANERAVASQKSADASTTSANAASASADTSKTQAQESARQAGIATQKAKDATDQADRAKAQADEATRQAGIATADVAETKKQVKLASDQADRAKGEADRSKLEADRSTEQANRSETQANTSEKSAKNAGISAAAALSSQQKAKTSEDNAKASETEATRQAGIATAQAIEATKQAGIATTQAGEAKKQATTATTKAQEASTSAQSAKTSAQEATRQAETAATQATEATKQAKIATTEAQEASTSATNAKASETKSQGLVDEAHKWHDEIMANIQSAKDNADVAVRQADRAKSEANRAESSAHNAMLSEKNAKESADKADSIKHFVEENVEKTTQQATAAEEAKNKAIEAKDQALSYRDEINSHLDEANDLHNKAMALDKQAQASAKASADSATASADSAKASAQSAKDAKDTASKTLTQATEIADGAVKTKKEVADLLSQTKASESETSKYAQQAQDSANASKSSQDEATHQATLAKNNRDEVFANIARAETGADMAMEQAEEATRQADIATEAAKKAKDYKVTVENLYDPITQTAEQAMKDAKKASDGVATINQSKADVAEMKETVLASQLDVETNKEIVKGLLAKTQQSEANAKASETAAKESETNAKTSETNTATMETHVDEMQTNVTNMQTNVTNMQTNVSSMKDNVSQMKQDVIGLKSNVSSMKDDVTQLKADTIALKDQVTTARNETETFKTQAGTSASAAATSESNTKKAETNVTQMKADVTQMKTDVSKMKDDVTKLKSDTATIKAQADETKTAIETLKTATETSAKKASDSATAAAQSATNAKTSETTAIDKATEATTQAGKAKTSAETATSQATIATTKAGEASTSAGEAKTQAGIATTKATEASTSATAAAGSAKSASDTKTAIDQEKDRIDKAVDKLENLKIGGENLVDLTSLTVGRFDSSGSLYTQDPDSHYSTDFIRVKKDEPYTCSISPLAEVEVFTDNYDKTNKYLSVSLYGADKSYLGRLFIKSIPEIYAFKDHKYTFKPNDTNLDVAYVRLSFPQTLKSYVKLERGTIQTDYSISTRTMNKNFGSRISSIESKTKTYSESTYISLTELGCTQDTEDCSIIINKALKEQSKNILVPVGEWKIKKPIIMQSNGPHLIGVNRETCIIKKTTDDVDDIYGVNAAIIFGGANKDVVEGYNYTIKDITIRSHTLYHGYGIYGAINVGTANVSWMNIQKFEIGLMFPKNIWVSQFEDMNIADSDYGCKFTSSGTTMLMRNIYVMTPKTYGYYLSGLSYTHCENLACDWAMETATCYGLYFCGIVINGIGCESPKSKRIIDANNSNTSISQGYIEVNHDNEDAVVFRVNGGYMSFNGVTLVDTKQSEGKAKSKLYHVSTKAYVVMSNCLRNVEFGGKSITDDPQNRLTIIDGGVVTQIDNFTTSGNPHADPSLLLTNQRSGAIFWATYGHFHQTPAPEEKNRGWETQIASQGDIVIEANPEETGVVGYQVTDYKDEDTFKETVKEISSDGWITLNNNNCNSETHQGYAPMHVGREIKNQNGAKASIVDFIYRQGKIKIDKTDGFAVGDKLTLSKLIYHRDLNHVNIPALLYGPEHRMPTYDWSFVPGISYFDTDNDRYKMWNGAKWKDVVFKQDLRVGGVNLLRNTDTMDDSNYWQIRDWTRSDAKYDSTYNGEIGDNVGLSTTNLTKPGDGEKYFDYVPMLHLNTNETYTLSIYGYNIDRIRFFENLNDGGNHYHDSQNGMYDFVLDSETSEWQKFTITFKPSNKDFYLTFGINSTGNSWVSSIKLERGNVATNWSPSPADIKSKIEDAKSKAEKAQVSANNAQSTANIARDEITHLTVGGSNHIQNADKYWNLLYGHGDNVTAVGTRDGSALKIELTKRDSTGSNWIVLYCNSFDKSIIAPNTDYTYSFKMKVSDENVLKDSNNYPVFVLRNGDGSISWSDQVLMKKLREDNDGYVTFTATVTTYGKDRFDTNHINDINCYVIPPYNLATYWFKEPKLEIGNMTSDWSIAPEDAGKRAIEKADFNNINMLEDVDYMDDRWYFTMNDQIVQSVKTSEITEKNNEIVDSGSATGKNIVVYHSLNTDSTGKTIQLHYYGSLFLTKGNEYTFSIYGANLKSILLDMDYSDPDNPDGAVMRMEVPVIIEEESKELSLYQATFEAPMTTGYSLTIYLELGSSSAWATPKLEKGAYAVGQVRNKNDFIKAFSPFIEQDTAPNENLISWNRVMNRNCFAAKFDYQTKIWTTWVTKGDDIFGYGLFTSGGAHSWVLPYGESITYSFEVKPSERLRWQADVNSIAQSALGTDYTGNDIDKYLERVYRKNGIKIPTDSEGKIKVDSYLEPNKWTKCSFTFSNTYADRNKNKVSIEDNNVDFGVVTNSLDAGKTVTVQYRNIKVEYGDKPTRFIGYKQEDNSGENFIKNSGSLGNARMSYAGTGSPETYAGSGYDKLVPSGRYLKFTANNSGISTFIDKWNYEDINLQAGESVTLSVYMKTDCDDSLSIGDVGLNFSAEFMSYWLNNNQLTNSWKRFILTGIANKDVSSKSPWNNSAITFYFPEFPKGKSLYISSPKLERGSVATAWSERPIDNNTIVDRLLSVIFDVAGPQELTKGSLIYRGQTIDNNCNLIDDSSRSTIKGISLALITELYNLSSTISIVVAGKTTGSQYSVDLYFIKGSNNIIGKQTISANVDKSPFFNITDIDRTYMEKMISLGVDSLIVSYKDNFDTKVKIYFRDAFASLPDSFFNGD